MRIKRMSLQRYMKDPKNYPFYLEEIPVVFNRNGWYLSGDQCWFEYNGKAFTQKRLLRQFKYEFKAFMIPKLSKKHVDAIKVLQEVPEFRPLMREMQCAAIQYRFDKMAIRAVLERRKRFSEIRRKLGSK